ncbi:MAG: MBL fold metallo-hydrolase, partial [Proteobacteria bacterium]|jgi:cyclase|nr:MBL fold metallo-hydrolase [Pseudomonadota bacterium]
MNNRYGFLQLVFMSLVASALFSVNAQAQDFDAVEIKSHKVTDNIYMLEGAGGNIGLFFGEDGAFMIDDQFAPLSEKIVAAIREITDEEIRFLINTHVHGDHIGGNENFSALGALIVAHDNVRQRMVEGPANLRSEENDPPSAVEALPLITLGDEINFHLNGERVNIVSFGPAHTDGDVFVHFIDSNVMHMGDVFRTTTYPIIDFDNGGNFHGIIAGLTKAVERADDNTIIIPGHGVISDKAAVQQAIDMYVDILDGVKTLKDQGSSVDDVLTANPGAEYDERWAGEGMFGGKEAMLRRIYIELD